MGNCIGTAFAFSHNGKKVSPDDEFQDSAMVDEKISPGPELCSAMLKSEEIYHIIPQVIKQHGLKPTVDVAEKCNAQRVKIVVNRKQLQFLIKSAEEMKLRIAKGGRKWRPSLATIPEL